MSLKELLYNPLFRLSKLMSRRNLYGPLEDHFKKVQNQNDLKVMNIGAAGPVPKLLKANATLKVTNVDIDPSKNPDIVCDACDMRDHFQDETFDCVVIMEVLEHITLPTLAMAEIRRVLRPGGWVLISVPFMFPIHAEPHDYWRFTRHGLEFLLGEGFADIKIRERNFYNESIVVLLARLGMGCQGWRKYLIYISVPLAALLWPVALAVDFLCKDYRATTGYFVTAKRK